MTSNNVTENQLADVDAVFEKYRRAVEILNQKAFKYSALPTCPEMNPFELSSNEAMVFDIDHRLNNALYTAYSRYENMLGICYQEPFTEDDSEKDRVVFAQFVPENWSLNHKAFCPYKAAAFMAVSCKLPYYQCMGYVMMREASLHRSGLTQYKFPTVSGLPRQEDSDDRIPF